MELGILKIVEEIVDEIEWLIKDYKANDFEFFDLTAIIKKEWILDFCNELKKRNLNNITWQLPSGTRSEAIDEDVCPLLYESGCRNMNYACLLYTSPSPRD